MADPSANAVPGMVNKLDQMAKQLFSLEQFKARLESHVEKYLTDICCVNHRIEETETNIEKIVQSKAAYDYQMRIRNEICKLKEERRNAEQEVSNVNRAICKKIKKLEQSQKSAPKL